MNPSKELAKIKAIVENERFIHKGTEYVLDPVATAKKMLKSKMENRPLRKLVSTSGLVVWSHDCEAVAEPKVTVVAEEPIETVADPVTKKAPKKAPKKKS